MRSQDFFWVAGLNISRGVLNLADLSFQEKRDDHSRQFIATLAAGWSPPKSILVAESYPKWPYIIHVKDL